MTGDILGVTHNFKITFVKHLSWVSRSATQRLSILRKYQRLFNDRLLLDRCFWGFILPVSEQYCSAVWCSTTVRLDRVISSACFFKGVCQCVTFHIVDLLLQYAAPYCERLPVTRALSMLLYLCLSGLHQGLAYTRFLGLQSVHLCTYSLQNPH